ncbi:MAG: TetR/AcrR family transcriptional regulator [Myxococcota bacterium]|nr:TetR/AcrR family transcriptional regulator [Myxococcota bacterium]
MSTSSVGPQQSSRVPRRAYDRLILAGIELMAREGLDGVNTNTIARAARVGVGTFYQHFEDKFALHRAIVQRALEGLQNSLAQAHQEADDRPLPDQVRAGVVALVGFAQAQPDLFRTTFGRSAAAARLNSKGRTAGLGLSARPLERRLRALLEEGELDPAIEPGIAARAFMDMQVRCVVHWIEDPVHEDPDALIRTITRLHPALVGQPLGGDVGLG